MYVPTHFAEPDEQALLDIIDGIGFAAVVSSGDSLDVSHIPLRLDRAGRRLVGHVAKANDHWQRFDGTREVTAIFMGPHAYISPSWYVTTPQVPTWNYVAVHVTGRARLLPSEAIAGELTLLVEKYEAARENRWSGELPEKFRARLQSAIVAFEVPLERIQGKLKLGQNRSDVDRERMLAGLEKDTHAASRALAAFTRAYLSKRP